MTSFRWLARRTVLAARAAQIAEHGGIAGIRDEGLLESALATPEHKAHNGDVDPAVLAAAFAYGIARNHPFPNGNKRTALVAMELFVVKNGLLLTASDKNAVVTDLRLAADDLSEDDLSAWICQSLSPRPS